MIKVISSIVVLITIGLGVQAQSTSAATLAQRMKDSLSLTDQQKTQIYTMNTTIAGRQARMQELFAGSSSLPYYLQGIETNRDELYSTALSDKKYVLYKSKKANIIR